MPLEWMRSPAKIGGLPGIRSGLQDMAEAVAADIGRGGVWWEIGSFAGESMEIMAPYCKTIHCVDPWADPCGAPSLAEVEASFDARALAAGNAVKHKLGSVEAAAGVPDGSIDLVYIDAGDHSYAVCKRDIDAWLPKVRKGGYIGGHDHPVPGFKPDVAFPDVARAVAAMCRRSDGGVLTVRLFVDTSWLVRVPA